MSTIELNLEYLNAARLLLPSAETINLALIGCGGTGSWLAPSVVRVGRLLKEKFSKKVDLYFVDPDHVEEKNVYRQNFCEAEIGKNKALALAFRYGLAWGMEISAVPIPFSTAQISTFGPRLTILIGCVDNAAARKTIQDAASRLPRCWWLDCGNHQSAGQIVVGCGSRMPKDPFELPGFCSWLPLPSDVHPDLLEEQPESHIQAENLSCADMAMRDSQGLAINQRIAAEASDYLVRMLITKDLSKYATYVDLASGTTKSKYIIRRC